CSANPATWGGSSGPTPRCGPCSFAVDLVGQTWQLDLRAGSTGLVPFRADLHPADVGRGDSFALSRGFPGCKVLSPAPFPAEGRTRDGGLRAAPALRGRTG